MGLEVTLFLRRFMSLWTAQHMPYTFRNTFKFHLVNSLLTKFALWSWSVPNPACLDSPVYQWMLKKSMIATLLMTNGFSEKSQHCYPQTFNVILDSWLTWSTLSGRGVLLVNLRHCVRVVLLISKARCTLSLFATQRLSHWVAMRILESIF